MSVTHAGSRRSLWYTTFATGVWLSAWAAGPAVAAHYVDKECDAASETTLVSTTDSLDTQVVSGTDLSDPRSIAELRSDGLQSIRILPSEAADDHNRAVAESASAFVEVPTNAVDELDPSPRSEPQESASIDARIPGVSDDDLLRIKRQMHRKDI